MNDAWRGGDTKGRALVYLRCLRWKPPRGGGGGRRRGCYEKVNTGYLFYWDADGCIDRKFNTNSTGRRTCRRQTDGRCAGPAREMTRSLFRDAVKQISHQRRPIRPGRPRVHRRCVFRAAYSQGSSSSRATTTPTPRKSFALPRPKLQKAKQLRDLFRQINPINPYWFHFNFYLAPLITTNKFLFSRNN